MSRMKAGDVTDCPSRRLNFAVECCGIAPQILHHQSRSRPMPNRRRFLSLAAGALAAPQLLRAQDHDSAMTHPAFFYASLGPSLRLYLTDPDNAGLIERGTIQ